MKRFGIILLGLLCSMPLLAQSVQSGLVLEYNGSQQKTPLSKVVIATGNAPIVTSDDQGQFTLSFRTLHAGDAIQFRRVELSGYEVMNTEALEAARVARNNDNDNLLRPQDARTEGSNPNSLNVKPSTLNIVMIRKEALRQLRDGYRSVAAQRYEKQLKATEEQLEQLRTAGQLAEEQYNARMDSLEADYEEKLSKLETYIDKFARIDLSDLDADEQKIISLVQAGDFDQALSIYESQNLSARLAQSRADLSKLTSARDQLADAAAQKAQERERLMASIERQILLLQMAGGEENAMKVLKIRHEVFLADQSDCLARRNYAAALISYTGDIQKAIDILSDGINNSHDDIEKGYMAVEVAWYYPMIGNYESAINYALLADSLLWPNRENDYKILCRSLPVITYLYLKYIPFVVDASRLPSYVQRLRQNWTPNETDPVSLVDYIEVLEVLTEYDTQNENHEQALWDVNEAIRMDSCLSKLNPYASRPYQIYAYAASTYAFEGKIQELQDAAYKVANSIEETFPKIKATYEVTILADAAYTVLEALIGAECYETANIFSRRIDGLGLFSLMEEKYSDNINNGLYKIGLSNLSFSKGEDDTAMIFFNEGIQSLIEDEDYASLVAHLTASANAKAERTKNNYKEAESLYQNAIEIILKDCDQQPDAFSADIICHYYLGITDLYKEQGNEKQAKKALKQAEKYACFELDKILINKRK